MNIKYRHYRVLDNLTEGRRPSSRGGATLAFAQKENGSIVGYVAYCCDKDNYCKAYGRHKAAGHLLQGSTSMRTYNGQKRVFQGADMERFVKEVDVYMDEMEGLCPR